MNFEALHALRDLDVGTAPFLLQEIFNHGDLKVRLESIKVLRDLDTKLRTNRVLREMLRIGR